MKREAGKRGHGSGTPARGNFSAGRATLGATLKYIMELPRLFQNRQALKSTKRE